jgi:hypothetical protein
MWKDFGPTAATLLTIVVNSEPASALRSDDSPSDLPKLSVPSFFSMRTLT